MGIWYSLPARKYGDDMAEINTRLHYKINGVTDEIKCYTTLAEVQNQGIPVKVGGVAGYAKYGPASDANASRGNYKPPGGTAQRILKQAQVPYGEKAYTTPGTYTFTVPAGVRKVKVAMCGGGSAAGSIGTASSFGTYLSASSSKNPGQRPEAIGYKLSFTGVRESSYGIGYGWGGMFFAASYYNRSNFAASTFDVTSNEVITVVVGTHGGGGSVLSGDGFVLIAWGGDIK